MHRATYLDNFARDTQTNWEMLESLLLIEEMVGATTPELVIFDLKFCSKGELQIAWPCAKHSYLWMSAEGKVAPNHYNSDHPRCIRSAKQDDKYGASNIVLPCPGS
jgi:hypothetical protein